MSTLVPTNYDTATALVFTNTVSRNICQIAESRLRNSHYAAIRGVSCEYHEGVLVRRGRLPTYYLKQIAQVLIGELDGVLEIANRVDVVRPPNPHPDGLDDRRRLAD